MTGIKFGGLLHKAVYKKFGGFIYNSTCVTSCRAHVKQTYTAATHARMGLVCYL